MGRSNRLISSADGQWLSAGRKKGVPALLAGAASRFPLLLAPIFDSWPGHQPLDVLPVLADQRHAEDADDDGLIGGAVHQRGNDRCGSGGDRCGKRK